MSMDIMYFLSCVLFPLLLLIFFNFLRHKQQSNKDKRKLPPGKMGFPLIGETMQFFNAQRRNKLYEEFVHPRIAKHGKIFKTRLIGSPTVIVNGADANKFLLSNEFKLVKSSWPSSSVHLMGKDSIMEKDGERHRFLRGVIGTSLGYAGLESLVPKLCNFVKLYLVKNWHGQEEISLYKSTKVLTFSIVFECLLGINVEQGMLDTFERVLEGVFSPAIKFPGSKFWRAMKARKEIEKMIVKVVREKRKEMEEGRLEREEDRMLMSKLVYGMIQGEISEKEIIDNVVLLVFAAHDTTSFAVAMTFKMMAQHPDCYDKVLQGNIISITIYFSFMQLKITIKVLNSSRGNNCHCGCITVVDTVKNHGQMRSMQPQLQSCYAFDPIKNGYVAVQIAVANFYLKILSLYLNY